MRQWSGLVTGLMILVMAGSVIWGGCAKKETVPSKDTPATTQTSPQTTTQAGLQSNPGLHSTQATGEKKFIVILADFPDVKRQYPERVIKDRFLGFLPAYYTDASYKLLSLKGDCTRTFVLPNPVANYKISSANFKVDDSRVLAVVTDAVNAADNDVDFSKYSFVVVALGATPKEYGMVGLCAIPGMLGWKSEQVITAKSGEKITAAAIFCETAHLGTYIHDTLHILGGSVGDKRMTPCLYDHTLQARYSSVTDQESLSKVVVNMGYWDPLSSHFPYKRELPPAGLSSWTKLRLDWIAPSKISQVKAGQTGTFKLDPLIDAASNTIVIRVPITEKTYYLVENRQKINSDANLPSSGVLILYADDSIDECIPMGSAPVKIMDANPAVPAFNDAAYDIGKNSMYVDTKNNVAIVLDRKDGLSYQVTVTTADKVKGK